MMQTPKRKLEPKPERFGFFGSGRGHEAENHNYVIPQGLNTNNTMMKDALARKIFVQRSFAQKFLEDHKGIIEPDREKDEGYNNEIYESNKLQQRSDEENKLRTERFVGEYGENNREFIQKLQRTHTSIRAVRSEEIPSDCVGYASQQILQAKFENNDIGNYNERIKVINENNETFGIADFLAAKDEKKASFPIQANKAAIPNPSLGEGIVIISNLEHHGIAMSRDQESTFAEGSESEQKTRSVVAVEQDNATTNKGADNSVYLRIYGQSNEDNIKHDNLDYKGMPAGIHGGELPSAYAFHRERYKFEDKNIEGENKFRYPKSYVITKAQEGDIKVKEAPLSGGWEGFFQNP